MTEAEYVAGGDRGAGKGAPLSEADFRYHPEELLGLTHALQQRATGS